MDYIMPLLFGVGRKRKMSGYIVYTTASLPPRHVQLINGGKTTNDKKKIIIEWFSQQPSVPDDVTVIDWVTSEFGGDWVCVKVIQKVKFLFPPS